MREILFRGKRVDDGKWVKGSYAKIDKTTYCFAEDYEAHPDNTKHLIIFDEMSDWGMPNNHIITEVDPSTVGQYTGLTDKDGKKIFEGDIIQMNQNKNDISVVEFGEFGCVEIEDESITDIVHGWYGRPLPTDALSRLEPFCFPFQLNEMWINRCNVKVIGNIHDNPELQGGTK